MPAGYTQPLYILPFDHRASFVSGLSGWTGARKLQQTAQVTAAKRVICVHAYDRKVRPALMLSAISDLQDVGVEVDVWKVEGLDNQRGCERIVALARRDGRNRVSCIVLGRGENEKHVRTWLIAAAGVTGFIAFAVGRTTFWEPLAALRDGRSTREAAVGEIARRYRRWVDIFERAKPAADSREGVTTTARAALPER